LVYLILPPDPTEGSLEDFMPKDLSLVVTAQSPEETLDIGKSGASTPSALRFLNYDVVKKTSLCWAL
jgi:hypothetical protein